MCRLLVSAQQLRCNLCVAQLSQPSNGDVVYVSSSYVSQVMEMQFMFRPVISAKQWKCSLGVVQWRCSFCVVHLSETSSGDVVYVSSSYLCPVVQRQFMCFPVISAQQLRCSVCVVQLSQPSSGDVVYVSSSYLSPVVETQFMFRLVISAQQQGYSLCRPVISAQQWRCSLCVVQLSQPSSGDVVYVSSSYLNPAMERYFMFRPVISSR